MQTKTFFRLVNPKYEPINNVIDTDIADMPSRMKRSVELLPLFNILLPFWIESKVQLDTAFDCMLKMSVYLKDVQIIESQGGTILPTSLINPNEKLSEIPLITLKKIIFPYYDLYNQTGMSIDYDDLPYIWEFLWAVVRKNFYPDKLDRFKSIFLFDSIEKAQCFQNNIDPLHERVICNVKLIETRAMDGFDMGWLDNIPTDCTFEEMMKYVRNYWEGKTTSEPTIEYLFSGCYSLKELYPHPK